MFGIGLSELILIAVAVFIFVGPQRLPGLMQQLARFYVQLKRASLDVKDGIDKVIQDAEAEIEREKTQKLLTEIVNHDLTIPGINQQKEVIPYEKHVSKQDPHPSS